MNGYKQQKRANTYKCNRCTLHGVNAEMKNHRRFCPYLHCKCVKCDEFLDYRTALNRKRQLERHANKLTAETPPNQSFIPTIDSQPLPQFLFHQIKESTEEKDSIKQKELTTTTTTNLNLLNSQNENVPISGELTTCTDENSLNIQSTPKTTFQLLSNYSNPSINSNVDLTPIISEQTFEPQLSNGLLLQMSNSNFNNNQLKQMLLWQSLMVVQLFSNELQNE